MVRVKRGVTQRRRHKKVLKAAKGFRGQRGNLFRQAKQAVMKAGLHAYHHRRTKKRDLRAVWIIRINAATREQGMSYSRFIAALQAQGILLDRKILASMAMNQPEAFKELVKSVMTADTKSVPAEKAPAKAAPKKAKAVATKEVTPEEVEVAA